jgi:hypothetical protein
MLAKGQLISEGNFGVIPPTSIKPKPQSARKEAREAGFLVVNNSYRKPFSGNMD